LRESEENERAVFRTEMRVKNTRPERVNKAKREKIYCENKTSLERTNYKRYFCDLLFKTLNFSPSF